MLGIVFGLFLVLIILAILSFVFWVFMFVHALQHDSPNKSTWTIILAVSLVLGLGFIAAVVYYFAEKDIADKYPVNDNQPNNQTGQGVQQQAPVQATAQQPPAPKQPQTIIRPDDQNQNN